MLIRGMYHLLDICVQVIDYTNISLKTMNKLQHDVNNGRSLQVILRDKAHDGEGLTPELLHSLYDTAGGERLLSHFDLILCLCCRSLNCLHPNVIHHSPGHCNLYIDNLFTYGHTSNLEHHPSPLRVRSRRVSGSHPQWVCEHMLCVDSWLVLI